MTTPFNVTKTAKCGLFCLLILLVSACKKTGNPVLHVADSTVATPPVTTAPVTFLTPSYDPTELDSARIFNSVPVINHLARTDLVEISGVAASRVTPGLLYIHNDSGNPNQVYLTDGSGADKGTLTLTQQNNRDWEDIAVGPGPIAGKSYVYVADIGDNDAKYNTVMIYRFPEPDLTGKSLPFIMDVTNVDKIELKYPDGPRNAETLMVDPLTRDIYIASKESNLSKIYVARYPQSITTVTTLSPLVELLFNKATGGDISADGSEILLRSKEQVWYWKLPAGTSISAGLVTKPQYAPYFKNEPQGEGIGFAADGTGYYTDTEVKGYPGALATISFYKRK